jgi:predicted RNase H-like HicB family nuclease
MKLSIRLVELEKEYIANCPELDVNCYGSNREEAIRRLKNVLRFYIDSAHEFGLEVESFESISIEGDIAHGLTAAENPAPSKSIN